jgi:hypothetical protein
MRVLLAVLLTAGAIASADVLPDTTALPNLPVGTVLQLKADLVIPANQSEIDFPTSASCTAFGDGGIARSGVALSVIVTPSQALRQISAGTDLTVEKGETVALPEAPPAVGNCFSAPYDFVGSLSVFTPGGFHFQIQGYEIVNGDEILAQPATLGDLRAAFDVTLPPPTVISMPLGLTR